MQAIEIQNLSFGYANDSAVFSGLNLAVERGERVGILGPNGAGKTTLMHLILGLLNGAGSIRVGGLELNKENLKEVRRLAGLVMQDSDSQLFMPTVLDDVMFGLISQGEGLCAAGDAARRTLAELGLEGLESRGAQSLSGGEKRRVAIASVMVMRPEILLLDEPSLNLDPRSRRELIRLLDSMEMTQVIASHDLDFIWDLCTRVVVLDGGTVVADGAPDEILRDEALLIEHGLDLPLSLQLRNADCGLRNQNPKSAIRNPK